MTKSDLSKAYIKNIMTYILILNIYFFCNIIIKFELNIF